MQYILQNHPNDNIQIGALTFVSYFSMAWLLRFIIEIVNHNSSILDQAFELLDIEHATPFHLVSIVWRHAKKSLIFQTPTYSSGI